MKALNESSHLFLSYHNQQRVPTICNCVVDCCDLETYGRVLQNLFPWKKSFISRCKQSDLTVVTFFHLLCARTPEIWTLKHQWGGNYTKRYLYVNTRAKCRVKSTHCAALCLTLQLWYKQYIFKHLSEMPCYIMKQVHSRQRTRATKLDWMASSEPYSTLTCSPALICHFAGAGKTFPPGRRAAWAAARWCEPCWWAPSPPHRAPLSAARPASPSLRPLWRFLRPAFRDRH